MPRIKWRQIGLASGICTLLLVSAVGIIFLRFVQPGESPAIILSQFTQNEVTVRVEVRKNSSGDLILAGVFTPTRDHFHLYSKDLPENGLNGLGRPTLMKVVASDGIKWMGPLSANQPEHLLYYKTLAISFPVYPEGAVTLSLPFQWTFKGKQASAELALTYMACSDQTCLPPLVDKHLLLKISPEMISSY